MTNKLTQERHREMNDTCTQNLKYVSADHTNYKLRQEMHNGAISV